MQNKSTSIITYFSKIPASTILIFYKPCYNEFLVEGQWIFSLSFNYLSMIWWTVDYSHVSFQINNSLKDKDRDCYVKHSIFYLLFFLNLFSDKIYSNVVFFKLMFESLWASCTINRKVLKMSMSTKDLIKWIHRILI